MKTLFSCMAHSKYRITHIRPGVRLGMQSEWCSGFEEKNERGHIAHSSPTHPYFIGGSGLWYSYQAIAELIRKYLIYAPELKAAHINKQLEFLGIKDEFETGTTPFQLPYSFY